MSEAIFRSVGGRQEIPEHIRMQGITRVEDVAPEDISWNFGLHPKTNEVRDLIRSKPSFHAAFPNLVGAWDGTSTVNHVLAAAKVLGEDKVADLIQYQPRGTCGGRSGSAAGDFVQLITIAAGTRAKFHRTSHAAVYFAARKKYGMLNGSWQNDNNDGVASGAVPEALSSVAGYVQREEIGDLNYYGPGSDDLACKLGAGMLPDIAAKILKEGADNFITWHPVHSAQELADGIAAGGIGLGSDSQGFTMTRDSEGFCRRSGTWQHYQIRVSVGRHGSGGRKGFGYWQSWGKTTPSGTLLAGHPGNCFGVDFQDQDTIIRSGDWCVVMGFPLYDLQNDPPDIHWIF